MTFKRRTRTYKNMNPFIPTFLFVSGIYAWHVLYIFPTKFPTMLPTFRFNEHALADPELVTKLVDLALLTSYIEYNITAVQIARKKTTTAFPPEGCGFYFRYNDKGFLLEFTPGLAISKPTGHELDAFHISRNEFATPGLTFHGLIHAYSTDAEARSIFIQLVSKFVT